MFVVAPQLMKTKNTVSAIIVLFLPDWACICFCINLLKGQANHLPLQATIVK